MLIWINIYLNVSQINTNYNRFLITVGGSIHPMQTYSCLIALNSCYIRRSCLETVFSYWFLSKSLWPSVLSMMSWLFLAPSNKFSLTKSSVSASSTSAVFTSSVCVHTATGGQSRRKNQFCFRHGSGMCPCARVCACVCTCVRVHVGGWMSAWCVYTRTSIAHMHARS